MCLILYIGYYLLLINDHDNVQIKKSLLFLIIKRLNSVM